MLTATVTKVSVTTNQEKLYSIALKLVLQDTLGEGFTKDYTCEYRTGESVANKVQEFKNNMQQDIGKYKDGQTVFNSSALNMAITDIQNGLTL